MMQGMRDSRMVMGSFVENPGENLNVVDLEAGHWVMLEKWNGVDGVLETFLENGALGGGDVKASI